MTGDNRKISILGTRGIPARHGGFETFAERLALHLAGRGWAVTVYCQESGSGRPSESSWKGVRLVHLPVSRAGASGTMLFDWKSTLASSKDGGLMLVLGYNTAVFNLVHRLRGRTVLMNMDGIEWQRRKWSMAQRAWLYANERAGCLLSSRLIADHPQIKAHLSGLTRPRDITVIPYGADRVETAAAGPVEALGLEPGRYCLVVARPEPENRILEMVSAFSLRRRGCKLVVLGAFDPEANPYHRMVLESAGPDVLFPGAIYDRRAVESMRFHCMLYMHGHSVGGTNPSLVEALGAGSAVLAHDNRFNRWVAGQGAMYFSDEGSCARALDEILGDMGLLSRMKEASLARHAQEFRWDMVLSSYEALLAGSLPARQ